MPPIIIDRRVCVDKLTPLIQTTHPCYEDWQTLLVRLRRCQPEAVKEMTLERVDALFSIIDAMEKRHPNPSSKTRLAYEEARAHIMVALLDSLPSTPASKKTNSVEKPLSWSKKLDFWSLFGVGTFYAACLGVTGISSVLGLFHLPLALMVLPCVLFAGISIFIYYGFDLRKISAAGGVPFLQLRSYIHAYLEQQNSVDEGYRRLIHLSNQMNPRHLQSYEHELNTLQKVSAVLERMHASTKERRRRVACALKETTGLKATRYSLMSVAGLLYGSAGFFVGHGMATILLGLLVTPPAAIVVSTVTIACGLLCAYPAYRSYRRIEQANMGALVGRIAGMPEKPLKLFIDAESDTQLLANTLDSKLASSRVCLELQRDVEHLRLATIPTASAKPNDFKSANRSFFANPKSRQSLPLSYEKGQNGSFRLL